MFEVSAEWVRSYQSVKGGWNRAQLEILGVKWPPSSGWVIQVVGRLISDEDKRRFEQLQGQTLKLRKAGQSGEARKV